MNMLPHMVGYIGLEPIVGL